LEEVVPVDTLVVDKQVVVPQWVISAEVSRPLQPRGLRYTYPAQSLVQEFAIFDNQQRHTHNALESPHFSCPLDSVEHMHNRPVLHTADTVEIPQPVVAA
jgi:hypothetical protein